MKWLQHLDCGSLDDAVKKEVVQCWMENAL